MHGSNGREGKKHLEYQTYTKCINQGGLYRLHLLHFSFSRGETHNKCFLSSQSDLVYVGEDVKISHMSLLALPTKARRLCFDSL
jgi:hypothetical protein